MAMGITELDPIHKVSRLDGKEGADHPMRAVTHDVAAQTGWTAARASEVSAFFDSLAPIWNEKRQHSERNAPLVDALQRGGADLNGRWLELGCGTGLATGTLADHVSEHVAVDLSAEMLAHADQDNGPYVRADADRLPFRDGEFAGILAVNMFLFPAEVNRVLADEGWLVWVNSRAERTPIYLSVEELQHALPGTWTGVTSRSGPAMWASIRRG